METLINLRTGFYPVKKLIEKRFENWQVLSFITIILLSSRVITPNLALSNCVVLLLFLTTPLNSSLKVFVYTRKQSEKRFSTLFHRHGGLDISLVFV